MTNLIRCRGSLSEIIDRFEADSDPGLMWRPLLWPGHHVLVVTGAKHDRRLQLMPWGLPSAVFTDQRQLAHRATLFGRELIGSENGISAPDQLARCLIVLESFAYPQGPSDQRTRSWGGLWDEPVCAWAGLCTSDESGGCAGILATSNDLVGRVSSHMPLLLPPSDRGLWLKGGRIQSLGASYPEGAWYLEPSDEQWSSGMSTTGS